MWRIFGANTLSLSIPTTRQARRRCKGMTRAPKAFWDPAVPEQWEPGLYCGQPHLLCRLQPAKLAADSPGPGPSCLDSFLLLLVSVLYIHACPKLRPSPSLGIQSYPSTATGRRETMWHPLKGVGATCLPFSRTNKIFKQGGKKRRLKKNPQKHILGKDIKTEANRGKWGYDYWMKVI